MIDLLNNCRLCPRNCGVDRLSGNFGFCGGGTDVKVARSALHFWEEPCISGTKGSGTVFFSGCTLKCIFCQNHKISRAQMGEEISNERLAELFLEQQENGALNINLVTPTHYAVQIIEALDIAKSRGLKIPIVYNTSGYEKYETIKALDGYIDIYLPDFKYFSDKYAVSYSNAPKYFEYASKSLEEMVRQTGSVKFDSNDIALTGTIVRHLMLPGLLFDSKKVLDYLYRTFSDDIYISIMNQYTPIKGANLPVNLQKKVSWEYYNCLLDYAVNIGIKNAYVQDKETADESFIPEFYDKV